MLHPIQSVELIGNICTLTLTYPFPFLYPRDLDNPELLTFFEIQDVTRRHLEFCHHCYMLSCTRLSNFLSLEPGSEY